MKNIILVSTIVAVLGLTACSSVKEMFPDKSKDYQHSTDIAPLTIPDDLAKGMPAPSAKPASVQAETSEAEKTTDSSKPRETTVAGETVTQSEETRAIDEAPEGSLPSEQAAIEPQTVTVDLLQSSSNITYLRMNTPFAYTWRAVSKGLSRRAIEVNERNQAEKTFVVQYDPDEKPVSDGSYQDELNFILHGLSTNDKEYRLKLVESSGHTDVVILNEELKPVSDEASLKLLGVLQKSIKNNLAGK